MGDVAREHDEPATSTRMRANGGHDLAAVRALERGRVAGHRAGLETLPAARAAGERVVDKGIQMLAEAVGGRNKGQRVHKIH